MINIDKKDDQLVIGGFPEGGFSFNEMQENFHHIKSNYTKNLKTGIINLKGVNHKNYSVLSFIISLAEFCRDHSISLQFINITDEKLDNVLAEIGIDSDGTISSEKIIEKKTKSVFLSTGECIFNIGRDFKKFAEFFGDVIYAVFYFIRHPRKLKFHEILYYMDKTGADGIPVVFLICFLVGLIIAYQSIDQLAVFGLEVYVADLVAMTLVRELGPLLVAVVCIGRAGSAFAAEIGTMKVSEEIDAMVTMGVKPSRVLVIPKMIALIIVMPMLTIIGDVSGILGGIVVGVPLCGVSLIEYCNRSLESLSIAGIGESLVKSVIFAVIIAIVGCLRGTETENDAQGVGKSTTSAVVTSILLVIIADFFVTFSYPQVLNLIGISY